MITFRHRIIAALWRGFPALTIALGLVIGLLATQLGNAGQVMPPLALMAVFYWCITQPERMPYWLIFISGMVSDALSGGYLGLSALLWMALRRVTAPLQAELEEAGFVACWAFFALALLGIMALEWMVMSLLGGFTVLPLALPMRYSIAILLYPGLHRSLSLTSQRMYRRIWFVVKQA